MIGRALLALAGLALLSVDALAQDPPAEMAAAASSPCIAAPANAQALRRILDAQRQSVISHRTALVLGVSRYDTTSSGVPPLANAANDAGLIATAAVHAGYHTLCILDPDGDQFRTILNFLRGARPGSAQGVADNDQGHLFFYFAGHGFQHSNQSYILPSSYSATRGLTSAINLRDYLSQLNSHAPFLVAAIDACRGPPPPNSGGADGYTNVADLSQGIMIQFSSAPGHLANDAGPRPGHGAYAPHFADLAELPGILFGGIFNASKARTRNYQGQLPADSNNGWSVDRWFHPASSPIETSFAQAWTLTYATGELTCPLAPTGSVSALVSEAANAEPELRVAFEAMIADIISCTRRAYAQPSYGMALTARVSAPVEFAPFSGALQRLGRNAQFAWSNDIARSGDTLTVRAFDPTRHYRAIGDVNPSDIRIPEFSYQRLLRRSDANETLEAARTMQAPVLFVPQPRTDAEALALINTQYELLLATVRSGAPIVPVEVLAADSTVEQLFPTSVTAVLVDQQALSQAQGRVE